MCSAAVYTPCSFIASAGNYTLLEGCYPGVPCAGTVAYTVTNPPPPPPLPPRPAPPPPIPPSPPLPPGVSACAPYDSTGPMLNSSSLGIAIPGSMDVYAFCTIPMLAGQVLNANIHYTAFSGQSLSLFLPSDSSGNGSAALTFSQGGIVWVASASGTYILAEGCSSGQSCGGTTEYALSAPPAPPIYPPPPRNSYFADVSLLGFSVASFSSGAQTEFLNAVLATLTDGNVTVVSVPPVSIVHVAEAQPRPSVNVTFSFDTTASSDDVFSALTLTAFAAFLSASLSSGGFPPGMTVPSNLLFVTAPPPPAYTSSSSPSSPPPASNAMLAGVLGGVGGAVVIMALFMWYLWRGRTARRQNGTAASSSDSGRLMIESRSSDVGRHATPTRRGDLVMQHGRGNDEYL